MFISPEGLSRKGEWENGKRLYWQDEDNDSMANQSLKD